MPEQSDEKAKAKRLARVIADDIARYNEAKIIKSIEQDNFFEALKDELEKGREHYKSRVSPELYQETNYYDRAIVDVILKPKANVRSKIW
jgi:hypothetical protein